MVKVMKNKEKYNLAHLHIVERAETNILGINMDYVEIEYNGKIVKEYACTNEAGIKKFLEWLEEEYKTEILTEKEKAYLSAVINPFRETVEYIQKIESDYDDTEYINMIMKRNDDYCALPVFERGTMYKGMTSNTDYTLKELGL